MRIVGAFKLNPYEILELNMMPSYTVTETEIRELSLIMKFQGFRVEIDKEISKFDFR